MPDGLKGFLIVLICSAFGALIPLILCLTIPGAPKAGIPVLIGTIFGFLYGLEAGILLIYALDTFKGWAEMIIDLTWSLPNTVFGFVFGNLIYWFVGSPDRSRSENAGWIVFMPRSSTGFGNTVLQTLGTINLGDTGQHEKMHLLQARIFGPLYLTIFGVNYAINFLIQVLFMALFGWWLKLAGCRTTAWFEPPPSSAVHGFFGWIYHSTLFELWAYASGNP